MNIEEIIERLKRLEHFTNTLSQQINNEIVERKIELDSYKKENYLAKNELKELKKSFERYDNLVEKNIKNTQYNIENDVANKNRALMEYIDTNLIKKEDILFLKEFFKQKDYINNNHTKMQIFLNKFDNEFGNNFNESNDLNFNDKNNNKINSEFVQYRTNLNEIKHNLNEFKKNYCSNNEEIKNNVTTIDKDISYIKETFEDISSRYNELENHIQYNNDIQMKCYNDLNCKLNELYNTINEKQDQINNVKNFENIFNKKFDDLNNLINNINSCIQKNNFDLNNKIKTLKETLLNQINNQFEEINKFEQNICNNFDKFKLKIYSILEQNTDEIKSICDYTNTDVNLLRNRNQYLEKTIDKLRNDVFDSIKESDNFMFKKIDHLCLNNNNNNLI